MYLLYNTSFKIGEEFQTKFRAFQQNMSYPKKGEVDILKKEEVVSRNMVRYMLNI